jgi:ribosome-binding protein aMBF1 (putative translation factor)
MQLEAYREKRKERIKELLKKGLSANEIADRLACEVKIVRRVEDTMPEKIRELYRESEEEPGIFKLFKAKPKLYVEKEEEPAGVS